jgi:hypothetical protein
MIKTPSGKRNPLAHQQGQVMPPFTVDATDDLWQPRLRPRLTSLRAQHQATIMAPSSEPQFYWDSHGEPAGVL